MVAFFTPGGARAPWVSGSLDMKEWLHPSPRR